MPLQQRYSSKRKSIQNILCFQTSIFICFNMSKFYVMSKPNDGNGTVYVDPYLPSIVPITNHPALKVP
ncbi:hypothetical protein L596_011680 [Steinernema carpocapsae]|uniref:Uncharacterized protein n=1 Tax=Steinernema carpocapsae TaxID=34508 RepID=A0A4U5NV43_STECR|nr:hypothetical protein L596_011680 [Steinernema carpocapsae]